MKKRRINRILTTMLTSAMILTQTVPMNVLAAGEDEYGFVDNLETKFEDEDSADEFVGEFDKKEYEDAEWMESVPELYEPEIVLEGDGSAEATDYEYEDVDLQHSVEYEDLDVSYATSATYSVDAALAYGAEHWNDGQGACAEFVCRCVQAGGLNISIKTGTGPAYREICSASGLSLENLSVNSDGVYVANTGANAGKIAAGDVVLVWCNTHDICPHMMICSGFDSSGRALYYAHNKAKNNEKVGIRGDWYSGHSSSCSMTAKVIRLSTLKNGGRQPEGSVELISGGKGYVKVRGTAVDSDDPSRQLEIHVYVGGAADSGAPGYIIKTDVNHRFDEEIWVDQRGQQEVHVYAIDIGDVIVGNPEIGKATVDIQEVDYRVNIYTPQELYSSSAEVIDRGTGSIYSGHNVKGYYYPDNDYIDFGIIQDADSYMLVICPKSAGHINLPFSLIDGSGNILYTKYIDCTIHQSITDVVSNQSKVNLSVGQEKVLSATVYPEDAYTKTVYWESDNPDVATVDRETGTVTAIAPGTANITVRCSDRVADEGCYQDGRTTDTCQVTVKKAGTVDPTPIITPIVTPTPTEGPTPSQEFRLNKKQLSMNEGQTETLKATGIPENAKDYMVSWGSSDLSVATVTASEDKYAVNVVALKPGTATISMTLSNGQSAECTVTVLEKNAPVPTDVPTPTGSENSDGNGFRQGEDGDYYYYEQGRVAVEKNGYVSWDGSRFFLVKGKVDRKANGLVQDIAHPDDWYFCSNGQAQTQYTGLAMYDGEWFYVENGKLNTSLAAYVEYDGGLFFVGAGRIMTEVNGLAKDPNSNDWYFLANGQAQTQYTGLAMYDGEWFYVVNGKLAVDYIGTVKYNGATFNVKNGMVVR